MNQGQARAILSQVNYQETPYQDSTWEVLDELPEVQEFIPLEVRVLRGTSVMSDPMFADYGGIDSQEKSQRWHLPEDLIYQGPTDPAVAEAERKAQEKARERELEELQAQAFEAGREQGILEAAEKSVQERQEIEERFKELFADLGQQLEEAIEVTERSAAALALQISRKIVGHAVEINPEYIIGIIREAIELAGTASITAIRVSPPDLEFLKVMGLTKELQHEASWNFQEDATIKAGCVVETSAGQVDYELDKAWDRVANKVLEIVK